MPFPTTPTPGEFYPLDPGAAPRWQWDDVTETWNITTGYPVEFTASSISLENVDNTSDLDKPISTATQGALDIKADKTDPRFGSERVPLTVTSDSVTIDASTGTRRVYTISITTTNPFVLQIINLPADPIQWEADVLITTLEIPLSFTFTGAAKKVDVPAATLVDKPFSFGKTTLLRLQKQRAGRYTAEFQAATAGTLCLIGTPVFTTNRCSLSWVNDNRDSFNTCTTFNGTWNSCGASLNTAFPAVDISSGVTFIQTWRFTSITSFPLLDFSNATSIIDCWGGCSNLTSFPLIDTSNCTNLRENWWDCTGLLTFPLINTANVTDLSNTWRNCQNLTSFPLINTSACGNFYYTWFNCEDLTTFPLINTANGTDFTETWAECSGLTSFPQLNFANGASFNGTWRACTSLVNFPLVNLSAGTNFTNAWQGCPLNVASTENVLVALNNNVRSGLATNVGTCPKTTWTTSANTAFNSLVARGWTITFVP
jgi:hypothetical protein